MGQWSVEAGKASRRRLGFRVVDWVDGSIDHRTDRGRRGAGRMGRTVGGESIVGVLLEGLRDREQAAHEPDVPSVRRLHGFARTRVRWANPEPPFVDQPDHVRLGF